MDVEKLVEDNIGLAYKIRHKFDVKWPEHGDEILSAAMYGLWRAAQSFDPEKGRFSTFAWPRMQGEVLDWMRKQFRDIRRIDTEALSYNALVDDLGYDAPSHEQGYTKIEDELSFQTEFDRRTRWLSARDRELILRHGREGVSLADLSDEYGISASRASQIWTRSLRRIAAA